MGMTDKLDATRHPQAIAVLRRLREWDQLESSADGPYWRDLIDRVLACEPARLQDSRVTSDRLDKIVVTGALRDDNWFLDPVSRTLYVADNLEAVSMGLYPGVERRELGGIDNDWTSRVRA